MTEFVNRTPLPDGRTLLPEPRIPLLLVDDQAMVGAAVQRLLADATDLHLHYCMDPLKAVSMAIELQPSVILQDLVMPNVDGLELLTQYRSHRLLARIPVIVLSADDNVDTKSRAFASGADDYLVKLPDRVELVARLRYHARGHLQRKQRDDAFEALRQSEARLIASNEAITQMNDQLEAANRRITELASTDALTGLANRRTLNESLVHWASRAVRKNETLAGLMLDLDHFKSVNDTYGHAVGDAVLFAVASMLTKVVRPFDLAARYGGEEFVVLLPETDLAQAQQIAERIRTRVMQLVVDGCPKTLTTSIGLAVLQPGESPQQLLHRADTALYSAKRNGRNRIEFAAGCEPRN